MAVLTAGQHARVRDAYEALMDSQVAITRESGPATLNPNTGTMTAPTPTVVYAGPALIRPVGGLREQVVEFGGQPVTLQSYTVRLPATVTDVRVEDEITVTASPDPALVGRKLRLLDDPGDDWLISRILLCEEA